MKGLDIQLSRRINTMSKRILSNLSTVLLALAMAFLVWVAAIREEDPILTKNLQSTIPLKIVAPAEDLFIVGQDTLVTGVQIKVRAPKSVWQTLTVARFVARIDLSAYQIGLHDVPVQVESLTKQATIIEVVPADVTVQLEPLAAKQLPVTVRIMDSPAQGYFNRLPVSRPISVTVKGSAAAVEAVEHIEARVFLNNSKTEVKQAIPLAPLTAEGNLVKEITLEPAAAEIIVAIEQRFGYKDVSVKAKVVGQPAPGYWVSSISVEPATVTLVGGPSILGAVAGFIETAEIDLSGATENVVKRVPLNLPPGASIVTDATEDVDNGRSVLVTIGVSALTGGRTMQVGLTVQGLRPDLTWAAAPETVEVILSGPLPILQKLKPDDITILLDVFDLPIGLHRLQPDVIYPDGLDLTSLIPDTVEVTIQSARGAPATATPTPTPAPLITPAPPLSGTTVITPGLIITSTIRTTTTLTSTLEITAPGASGVFTTSALLPAPSPIPTPLKETVK